jgi:hypothetical protein
MSDQKDEPRDVLAAEEFAMPAPDPRLNEREPHDVLAAEEFIVPAPDPQLRALAPRDVLAAEEFGVPAPDPVLQIGSRPLALPADPDDPEGTEPARDVLAAEEFAVPGGETHAVPAEYTASGGRSGGWEALILFGALGAALLLRTLVRRRWGPVGQLTRPAQIGLARRRSRGIRREEASHQDTARSKPTAAVAAIGP